MKHRIDFYFYNKLCLVVFLLIVGISISMLPIHIAAKTIIGVTIIIFGILYIIDILLKYQIPKKILTSTHYGLVSNVSLTNVTLEFDQYTMENGPLCKTFGKNEFKKIPNIGELIKVKMIIKNIGKY